MCIWCGRESLQEREGKREKGERVREGERDSCIKVDLIIFYEKFRFGNCNDREKERERDRERDRERQRERQRETERDRERQRGTERDREKGKCFCTVSFLILRVLQLEVPDLQRIQVLQQE